MSTGVLSADKAAAVEIDPVRIGPSWQKNPDGSWLLPERTLGWHAVAWAAEYLQAPDGGPWRYTPEQLRLTLWWYALDEHDRFLYRDGVIQRLKGWGKDPLVATWCAIEFVGPCRPDPSGRTVTDPWGNPHPAGVPHPDAWVQIAAVSKDQTRNTMTLFPGLFTKTAIGRYRIDLGKEIIYARQGRARIEAVTSSPRALEGARATFVVRNETHHWLANNEGHEMDAVIDRNATKSPDGAARAISITNAYDPSEDSVAQRAREAWEAGEAGTSLVSGIMYDSLEAPPDAPLTPEAAPAVIRAVRGDATWLDVDRIVAAILDPRNPPSRSRRFWYNQVVAAEDAWVVPQDFESTEMRRPDITVNPTDEIVVFFDGSKSDDATALVGCRVSDGHVITLGMWQRPPGERGTGWTAPRSEVDARVRQVFEQYTVVAFWADPSHTRDDETQDRYWDALIDEWHRRWSHQLQVWAVPGRNGHAVMWDMTAPKRVAEFTAAAERTALEIEDRSFTHDGDRRLVIHVRNARRYPNRYGVSLWKGHRESARKVDLAVAMVGARMLRRLVLNNPSRKRRRSGKVW